MIVRFGFQPLFAQLADGAGLVELGDQAAERIVGAVHPGVVVIAADHPLVGPLGAGQPGDHVVERASASS